MKRKRVVELLDYGDACLVNAYFSRQPSCCFSQVSKKKKLRNTYLILILADKIWIIKTFYLLLTTALFQERKSDMC